MTDGDRAVPAHTTHFFGELADHRMDPTGSSTLYRVTFTLNALGRTAKAVASGFGGWLGGPSPQLVHRSGGTLQLWGLLNQSAVPKPAGFLNGLGAQNLFGAAFAGLPDRPTAGSSP